MLFCHIHETGVISNHLRLFSKTINFGVVGTVFVLTNHPRPQNVSMSIEMGTSTLLGGWFQLCLYAMPSRPHAGDDKKLVQIHVMYVYKKMKVRRFVTFVALGTESRASSRVGSPRRKMPLLCALRPKRDVRISITLRLPEMEQSGLESNSLESQDSLL